MHGAHRKAAETKNRGQRWNAHHDGTHIRQLENENKTSRGTCSELSRSPLSIFIGDSHNLRDSLTHHIEMRRMISMEVFFLSPNLVLLD